MSATPTSPRKILITAALPYANGSIHIGHLVEYLQADFWSRFQKMRGNECVFICADDTHGTPIMVKAREQGITPEQLIDRAYNEHVADFKDFQVEFSYYGSTNTPENKALCEFFYEKFKAKNSLVTKGIEQLYCEHDKMFLPDRFVKGTCPTCGAKDRYGDSCDVCAATYQPADMPEVHCSVCGNKPVTKESQSIFFKLKDYQDYLRGWIPQHTAPDVAKKMLEWFNEDLRDLDISRDEPYFGFAIPGTSPTKYFYVWVDAPMGYISNTERWAKSLQRDFKEFWSNSKSEIYHFIGKDIARFHLIFWPAFLKAADLQGPNQVFVHGHLMVNGEKMSKSKGTFVSARTYLKNLNPEFLRYYYATKLNGTAEDLDLNLEDFSSRVNSDLVGKITNLASRGAQMLSKKMDGTMGQVDEAGLGLLKLAREKSEIIAQHYEARDFAKATNEIRSLADEANRYFDEKAPWKTLEADPQGTKKVLTTTLNLFRILAIYLQPVLPHYAERVAKLLGEKAPYRWTDIATTLENHKINDYEHLMTRIEADKIKAMVEESKTQSPPPKTASAPAAAKIAGKASNEDRNRATSSEIEFDDFMKVDLRVGEVLAAEVIPEADKLLRLKVDIGDGVTKQIIAGIKSAYSPEKLLGRKILVVANLKPRKMKFGMSEGMVLAAGDGGSDLFVLAPDQGAKTGSRVK